MSGSLQHVPFDSPRWRWEAGEHRLEEHLGRPSLRLRGGIAILDDVRLSDGEIEFEVAFSGERGFMGGVWRVQDAANYEEFYVRPHQSGNPDANQYTPVFNGLAGWQLYHGERYSVPHAYRNGEWLRVRIAFSGSRAEIYLGGAESPTLAIDELKRGSEAGSVGVSALPFAPAWFSHFSFTPAPRKLSGSPRATAAPLPGTVGSWWISDAFAEADLRGRRELAAADLDARSWTRLDAEPGGLANLARVQPLQRRRNTVFAYASFQAERQGVARLDFGFSDRARVYFNRRLLFAGNETSQSRDYRFLGSIGYFHALYLPLEPGENQLVLAISEDLGGWGIQAKIEDLPRLTLQDVGPRSPI